jgi:hypothetical protein
MTNTIPITVYIPCSLQKKLKISAVKKETTMTKIIIQLLQKELENENCEK